MSDKTEKLTACNRDCPDACGIIATIENGRVVRLQGDPNHPVTRGFLCRRTSRFLERQYSPDRLTQPLMRQGDQLCPASWDVCLDRIAETMLRVRAESGAAAIFQYRCGGSLGMMKRVGDYFFQRFGPVTVKAGDICSGAAEAAQMADFGCFDSNDLMDIRNSRTIVLWGKNAAVSNIHLLPLLKESRRRGAHVVLIDPVHTRTVKMCDQYIQPRPGGDFALACGMARWLFENGGIDPAAADYCANFAEYRRLVFARSVSQWSTLADVDEADLVDVARRYAQKPAAILIGWGLQRRRFGATNIRAIDALAAVSGNVGISGGGVSFYFARRAAFDLSFAKKIPPPRTIPEPLLGRGILAATDPPIRMVWISAANPVTMLPDSTVVAEALRQCELTVVTDLFLTDTAQCADIVLPTTSMLEEDDLIGAYGHHWLAEVRPVVAPPNGVKSDYEIIQLLARRVGLQSEFSSSIRDWKQRMLRRLKAAGIDLQAFAHGAIRNPFAPKVLFADRKFPTPSGKAELLAELPAQMLVSERDRSLRLAALASPESQSSQWPPQTQVGPAIATLHPDAASGFHDGQVALLRSMRGAMLVRLRFDARQRSDMVLLDKGGWLSAQRCANALIPAELTDDGQCAIYYDTPVELLAAAGAEEN